MNRDWLSVGVNECEKIHQTVVCDSSAVGIVHVQFLEDKSQTE